MPKRTWYHAAPSSVAERILSEKLLRAVPHKKFGGGLAAYATLGRPEADLRGLARAAEALHPGLGHGVVLAFETDKEPRPPSHAGSPDHAFDSDVPLENPRIIHQNAPMKKSEPQRRVALVIAKRAGLVLFGKRRDNGKYTLPGGHLENGEDPAVGARRELREETGLKPVGELRLVDERELREVKFYTFECEVDAAPSGKKDPDQECGIWAFFDVTKGIPKDVASNMAGPRDPDKNIALDLYGLAKGDLLAFPKTTPRIVDYTHRIWPQFQDAGYTMTVQHEPASNTLHARIGQHGKHVGTVSAPYLGDGRLGTPTGDIHDTDLHQIAHNNLIHRAQGLGVEQNPMSTAEALQSLIDKNKLGKQEELEKGAMARLAPFNPQKSLKPQEEANIAAWQFGDPDTADRSALPSMEEPARTRALHTLSAATHTRRDPASGERQFLLHRGVSPAEHEHVIAAGGAPGVINHPDSFSSWTPRWTTARNFANQYEETHGRGGFSSNVLSAWVPESAIHTIPSRYGAVDRNAWMEEENPDYVKGKGINDYRHEHEVVVSPGHSSKLATPEELHAQIRPLTTLHGRINDAGKRADSFGVTNSASTDYLRDRMKHRSMKKREQDDEIDRMLMHPNPAERSMALKLHGVDDKHLTRAFADEDPGIQRQALHHPALGHAGLLSLMQMPDREHLQHLALSHPAISRAHVEALYHTHKGRPIPEKGEIMRAISHHPHLDSSLIEKMVGDGNGDHVIENLNTPAHVIEHLIENHHLNPTDAHKRSLARRALKHPHAPAHLVEHSFKNGPMDVKIAIAQSQHMPEAIAQDHLSRGSLPAGDSEALLRSFIVGNPKATERHLKTALHDRNPIVRHAAKQKATTFKDYQSEFNKFFGHAMAKSIRPEDFKAVVGGLDPAGADTVNHAPDLAAHPPQHGGDVAAYKQTFLDSKEPVKRASARAGTGGNISRKVIYNVPATHATHGGARYMVKPYHERISSRLKGWQKHPHQGWAEMTNQALYHAAGIGNLHQNVHVVEHHMGEGHEAEPALVIKMDPGVEPLNNYKHGPMYVPEAIKHDARRIAVMDFLSNNLDRHAGNIMVGLGPSPDPNLAADPNIKVPNRLLALDHSRSFQYANNHAHKWQKRRDQPRHLEDQFGHYGSTYSQGSALKYLAPVEGNQFTRQDPYAWVNDWTPVFDWWGQNSDAVKAAMNKRLDQIKDPEVRKHIERNFNERTRYLDERANIGIEHYGDDWYKHPVPQYRPSEKTDSELEHERWARENPEYA
jgi:8-oxo-dGTP pyrophosphatase MutT (NUDIX family)